jgi:hypothetical protein
MNLAPDRLGEILCKREQRYVGSQLTFSFERQRIMLEETEVTRGRTRTRLPSMRNRSEAQRPVAIRRREEP